MRKVVAIILYTVLTFNWVSIPIAQAANTQSHTIAITPQNMTPIVGYKENDIQVIKATTSIPGSPLCGGPGQSSCGKKPAIFKQAAKGNCPEGSTFDIGNWACYTCPSGYERSAAPIDNYKACQKKRPEPKLLGEFMPASKQGDICPEGSTFDGIRGGECWKCPQGYGRTMAAIDQHNACQKDGMFGPIAPAKLIKKADCNPGEIQDGIGGNGGSCWTCPEGTDRTVLPINGAAACEKSEWFDFERATKLQDLTCPAGEVFDFIDLNQQDINTRPEFKTGKRPSPVESGTCWACPQGYERTSSSVKSDEACQAQYMVWQPGIYKNPGLFGFAQRGVVEKVLQNLLKRNPDLIASALSAAAEEVASTNDISEADALRAETERMKTNPAHSTVAAALVMRRIMAAIADPSKVTDYEKQLAEAFGRYIQKRRTFMAEEALSAYNAWKEADLEARTARNRHNLISLIDYGTVPPDFANIAAGTFFSTEIDAAISGAAGIAVGAIPVVGTVLGDLASLTTGEALNGFGNFKTADTSIQFIAKNSVEIAIGKAIELFMQKMAKETAKTALTNIISQQTAMNMSRAAAVKTATETSKRLLSTLTGAGPTVIITVASMILTINIENIINITEAPGRLNASLATAKQPVELSDLTRLANTPEGIAQLLSYWGFLMSGEMKPLKVFMDDWTKSYAAVEEILASKDINNWVQMPGDATAIGAGPADHVMVVGANDKIYNWNQSGQKWEDFDGFLREIDVLPNGAPIGLNSERHIFAYLNNEWTQLAGGANDIGVGANGAIWVIGEEPVKGGFPIYKWVNGAFKQEKGEAAGMRIDVSPDGTPWVINQSGEVFKKINDRWSHEEAAPKAQDIAISANGTILIVGQDGHLYISRGNQWAQLAHVAKIKRASVDGKGTVWAITEENLIYRQKTK
ncbi:tectonin domain-containing protein [Terasakiella pusilla]|uniref:tectonin domain-containing protein n=1 Tax=Terasakiella pusilla TaxID=64973 RepID=UPI003AA82C34